MANEQKAQDRPQDPQQNPQQDQQRDQQQRGNGQGGDTQSSQYDAASDFDGLKDKKPEELTPEELRWMADTMPGEGPGD